MWNHLKLLSRISVTVRSFDKAQGKITFGQLKALVDSATKRRIFKHVGEGGVKATIRLLPWFVPQLFIAGAIAGAVRAANKY